MAADVIKMQSRSALTKKLTRYPTNNTRFYEIRGDNNSRRNEVRTRVAFINPASVSPTCSDSSSVAKAKICGVHGIWLGMAEGDGVKSP